MKQALNTHQAAVVLLCVSLCGCGGAKKEEAGADPVTPVQVKKAEKLSIQRIVTANAVLYPAAQAAITAKITAPVRRVLVNRGDRVRKGQLLIELENRDLASAVMESRALYEQADAQFQTTTRGTLPEDMTRARNNVESAAQALDAAKRLYDNRVVLVREGALAQKLADDAKVALVQAQSQADITRRHLESLQNVSRASQTKAAQGQLDAARARVGSAQAQLSYAEIRSPIDGIVSDRPNSAGEMASSGNPIITIVDVSEIVARASIPVKDTRYLKIGDIGTITAPDGELTGKVTVISPSVDASSTTVEVWIRASNSARKLKPGVTAKVSIQAETIAGAIVVPLAALLSSDDGADEVMVAGSDALAHERKVESGVRQNDSVQITEGLREGETVVIAGGLGLADKAKIRVEAAPQEP